MYIALLNHAFNHAFQLPPWSDSFTRTSEDLVERKQLGAEELLEASMNDEARIDMSTVAVT